MIIKNTIFQNVLFKILFRSIFSFVFLQVKILYSLYFILFLVNYLLNAQIFSVYIYQFTFNDLFISLPYLMFKFHFVLKKSILDILTF